MRPLRVGPDPIHLVSFHGGEVVGSLQELRGRPCEVSKRVAAMERGLRRNHPSQHPDLRLPVSRLREIPFHWLSLSLWTLVMEPKQMTISMPLWEAWVHVKEAVRLEATGGDHWLCQHGESCLWLRSGSVGCLCWGSPPCLVLPPLHSQN